MPDLAYYASLPRARGAAAALLLDDLGRVLLVKPTYSEGWYLPGGVIEADESPLSACVRECEEELGLVPRLDGLACVDWGSPRDDGVDAVNVFVFGGSITGAEIAAIRLPPEELSDHVLVAPEKVPELAPPHVSRRMDPSLRAMADGRAVYLEDGREQPFGAARARPGRT
ncbi:ADP-ribose pyrophosphatase YjhB, NUDIX family [Actinomadura meyerae]|jgi:8-oxo-dGTP pyrophosphatase MutT (NUDIX family)|uniref:ADP-ribose pyrophosphatase YjhB, NUDIX family n=1 Tax=Actinomadura meyerae TaxID=240840 RepID=A0A239IZS6_9ACTN|nr:NUDIX hydrolase [Actinomadura meyerae]SNS98523.1 ADP-ribose pyrophosphatase YjhB, NUDIX family [Actinomadura meyerae]